MLNISNYLSLSNFTAHEKYSCEFRQNNNSWHSISALEMLTEEERLLNDTKDVYQKTSSYFLFDEVPVSC